MRIIAFNVREDEKEYFESFSRKYNVEVKTTTKPPTKETIEMAKGFDAICILTNPIDKYLLDKLKEYNINYISTRTIGFEHIDTKYANEIGISYNNVTYSPNTVSEYTVMLILMANRKIKQLLLKDSAQDFSLNVKARGRELKSLTVGVMGTGKIGSTVIEILSSFGCKILAFDKYESGEVKKYATYVSKEELIKNSDIISLHLPASEESYHIIDEKSIKEMKDGVLIVNTGRGALIDSFALIEGIESGKIAGAALDVVEDETDLYYRNRQLDPLNNRALAILKSFPNVIVTPHTAFYTNQAVSDMVENSILSCIEFFK